MEIDRRKFLSLGPAALAGLSATPSGAGYAGQQGEALFAACARLDNGQFAAVIVTAKGHLIDTIPLSGRGHDVTCSPNGAQMVVFARRPGTFAVAVDLKNRRPPVLFTAPHDRHFYGHGAFSSDGRLLYATENDFENARGIIGIYDVESGFSRKGEFATHGIGPHDVLLTEGGKTLCVANGGIETHPAAGRAKLNLHSMKPSIAFIDTQTGDLLSKHEPTTALHRLSLRHMCRSSDDRIWFAAQWEGSVDEAPILVGHVGRDTALTFCKAEETFGIDMKGYIGSIAASGDSTMIAASAPRAGATVFIDAGSGQVVGRKSVLDGCGVAALSQNTFLISSGTGELHSSHKTSGQKEPYRLNGLAFDNHMLRLSSPVG